MDNLFLEEFVEKDDNIKEIQIFNKFNTFGNNNDDNELDSIDDYDINTQTIIHKQENISENNNEDKIYDISSLYTKEITKERLLISYEDMNDEKYFNGSYEYQFNLNKKYKNVIGFRLDKAIYENIDRKLNGENTNIYLDVIINNIPREACMNNLKGNNIVKRLPYEYSFGQTNGSGVGYASLYSKPNYFYPINLDKLSLSLKYNHKEILTRTIIGASRGPIAVITTSTSHGLKNGTKINITDVVDMDNLNINNPYYTKITDVNTFELYSDVALTLGINSSTFDAWSTGGTVTFNPETDLIDLLNLRTNNFNPDDGLKSGLKFSFEFELTMLNR